MEPSSSRLEELLTQLRSSTDPLHVAYAHNYLFEERVASGRQTAYEAAFELEAPRFETWRDRHVDYLHARIWRREEEPESFLEGNEAAILGDLAEEQWIVRLENLDRVLTGTDDDLPFLSEQLDTWRTAEDRETRDDAQGVLAELCERWNRLRDRRPAFAAFHDELEDEIEGADWGNRVRNRLGLAHHNPASGDPIPVALMRYRVGDVLKAAGPAARRRAFAVPTVLDGELNAHYFPTPRAASYGRTLDLEPDPECERLASEILHWRIEYRPEHIHRLGWITAPVPPYGEGAALARRRNEHLFCVRYETGIETFGENVPEDAHA